MGSVSRCALLGPGKAHDANLQDLLIDHELAVEPADGVRKPDRVDHPVRVAIEVVD
jgi:hypothetical protein